MQRGVRHTLFLDRDSLDTRWSFLALFGQAPPGALQLGLIMPNKVHDCIGHGPESRDETQQAMWSKSPVRGWFGREGKSSTWSASAIPGSCADFLGRSSGGIERYQPCAYTHVITLSWMSVFIQTVPGEFAQLRGGTSTNLVATATSITGRILGQSFHFCAHDLWACRPHLLQQKMKRLSQ